MANVFVLLRDEKKSPEVNKRRQIPLSTVHDFKGSCEKSLMVSTQLPRIDVTLIGSLLALRKLPRTFFIFENIKMAKTFNEISSGYAQNTSTRCLPKILILSHIIHITKETFGFISRNTHNSVNLYKIIETSSWTWRIEEEKCGTKNIK